MAAIVIRRARPAEAPSLRELAIASKAHWGYGDEWMARWASLLRLPPVYVRTNPVFVATRDQVLGFYALIRCAPMATLDHLWVHPRFIGQGVGRALFTHALQCATRIGARRMEIESDPHAVGFYERMGAHNSRDTMSDMGRVLPILSIDLSAVSAPLQRQSRSISSNVR